MFIRLFNYDYEYSSLAPIFMSKLLMALSAELADLADGSLEILSSLSHSKR